MERIPCTLTLRFGVLDVWGRDGIMLAEEAEMKVGVKDLEAVLEFFYLWVCFLLEITTS